jgi:hypothetical protein
VVLGNLARQEPGEVLRALEQGVELDRPGARDRTESITTADAAALLTQDAD